MDKVKAKDVVLVVQDQDTNATILRMDLRSLCDLSRWRSGDDMLEYRSPVRVTVEWNGGD